MSQILTLERIKKIVDQKKVPDQVIDDFNRKAINAYSKSRHYVELNYQNEIFLCRWIKLLTEKGYHVESCDWPGVYHMKVWLDNSWKKEDKQEPNLWWPNIIHPWSDFR